MPNLVAVMPDLNADARKFAARFLEHPKSSVRKAAKILNKAVLGGRKPGAGGH
jgi:hypothetical protein